MIVLDTHVWVWWTDGSDRLAEAQRREIERNETRGLGVSAISCWEVAKLVELGRLTLDRPVLDWIRAALALPGIRQIDLTPEIVVASTELPGTFHRDPADQILVATARVLGFRLVTSDQKILDYAHVETIG